ncbi:STM2901 family protein [Serratia odorifera]|uniref:STM2901 family protein n=1 Tax=Serratia odorifera TaxID=618 RepID=UPI003D271CC4
MDTVEELGGTYFYKGMINLSAGELFFWIFVEETQKQLGASDVVALALIILGQPIKGTRRKPAGSTKGTSILSENLRRWINIETGRRLPTLTNASIRRMKFSYVTNLGAFAGRWIPILGVIFIANDISTIAWKTTTTYNLIARKGDKLWS